MNASNKNNFVISPKFIYIPEIHTLYYNLFLVLRLAPTFCFMSLLDWKRQLIHGIFWNIELMWLLFLDFSKSKFFVVNSFTIKTMSWSIIIYEMFSIILLAFYGFFHRNVLILLNSICYWLHVSPEGFYNKQKNEHLIFERYCDLLSISARFLY